MIIKCKQKEMFFSVLCIFFSFIFFYLANLKCASLLITNKNAVIDSKLLGYLFVFKAIGITNQRETLIVWDKKTGKPLYNAISKYIALIYWSLA